MKGEDPATRLGLEDWGQGEAALEDKEAWELPKITAPVDDAPCRIRGRGWGQCGEQGLRQPGTEQEGHQGQQGRGAG